MFGLFFLSSFISSIFHPTASPPPLEPRDRRKGVLHVLSSTVPAGEGIPQDPKGPCSSRYVNPLLTAILSHHHHPNFDLLHDK